MRSVKRALLLGAGFLSLGLGIVGILVPVLPTTPLLLLASLCFLKSSRRLHVWLLTHRVLGPYLYQWQIHRAISRQTKLGALTMLWVGIGVSVVWVERWWVDLALGVVLIAVTVHLVRMRTMAAQELKSAHEDYRAYCLAMTAE